MFAFDLRRTLRQRASHALTTTSPDGDDKYSYAWTDQRLISRIGIGVSLEGGVGGFTDGAVSDTLVSRGQGVWGLRMTFGTHTPIALDAAYVGTINSIDSLVDDNADLIGTAIEGALRWNILPHYKWNPYVFAGVGWQNYNVNNADSRAGGLGHRRWTTTSRSSRWASAWRIATRAA